MIATARDAVRLLVIVPTRNRADMAATAISSVLRSTDLNLTVLISDNSTSEDSRRELAAFCHTLDDPRTHYCRPSTPLAMTPHWEWVYQRALDSLEFSHILVVSDRTYVKRGRLTLLADLAARYPNEVISFKFDSVRDDGRPIRLLQQPWTDRVFEVSSAELLANIARLRMRRILLMYVPGSGNCIVPRAVLERMQNRFGTIFGSHLPDLCFAFRCLDELDSIVCYDAAPMVEYGLARSRHHALTSGKTTDAYLDWCAGITNHAPDSRYATPIPALETLINMYLHEYCAVKAETGSPKFPALDHDAYVELNAAEVDRLPADSQVRREKEAVLKTHAGLLTARSHTSRSWLERAGLILSEGVVPEVVRRLTAGRPVRFWRLLARKGVYFPVAAFSPVDFDSLAAALEYASTSPRMRNRMWSELEYYTTAKRLCTVPLGN